MTEPPASGTAAFRSTAAPIFPLYVLSRIPSLFWAGKNACPTLWQFVEEADHFEGRLGALLAFVSGVAAGAVYGLLDGIAGEHAEEHRQIRFQGDFAQTQADLPV